MKFNEATAPNKKIYNPNLAFEFIDLVFSFENTKIFCDMDGVLTNMVKHYFELTGKDLEDKVNNRKWYQDIHGNFEFWRDMPWLDDGKELWHFIKSYGPCVLTSPTLDKNCKKGKIEWVKRELGEDVPIIVALKKHLIFNEESLEGKILIDDKEKNIDPWVSMGGIGVLHKTASDSIAQLKKILEKT